VIPANRREPRDTRAGGARLLAAAAAVLLALSARAADAPAPDAPPPKAADPRPPAAWSLARDGWTLVLSPQGGILSLSDRAGRELVRRGAGDSLVRAGLVPPGRTPAEVELDDLVACRTPEKAERTPDGAVYDYALAPRIPIHLHDEIHFVAVNGAPAIRRTIHVTIDAPPLAADLAVSVGHPLGLPGAGRRVFVPTRPGIGEEVLVAPGRSWLWAFGGGSRRGPSAERLAIPLLSETADGAPLRLTTFADPSFTTGFRLAPDTAGPPGEVDWVLAGAKVPLRETEARTIWTVIHAGTPDDALAVWTAAAFAGVPEGPAWRHDVALVHTDFLSRDGRGWLEDVDALARLVPETDRPKALLLLHGWYDAVGRYAYDAKAGAFDAAWTALPGAAGGGVPMSVAEVVRRLSYARERGFRAGLVFAEGLLACDGAKDAFPADQALARSARTGPDQAGKALLLNPCHPRVQARFAAYHQALLEACGASLDALAWLETGDIAPGATGPAEAPGYAARALMRMAQGLAAETTRARPGIAFLSGDACGPAAADASPVALMAHGTCPAGGYRPSDLPYALFPCLRNAIWPVPRGAQVPAAAQRDAVLRLGVPVATSCGWGDEPGWARMGEAERDALIDLFRARAARPRRPAWLRE